MKRRFFINTIGLGMVAQLPFVRTVSAGTKKEAEAPKPGPVPPEQREPFIKIAKEKGVKIFFDQPAPAQALTELHLDMNMVRASIENTIARTKTKQPSISEKLARLLAQGTPVQQVEFVHGSGVYYFPEDLQKYIADAESAQTTGAVRTTGGQCTVCSWVCTTVCNCLGNGDQYCKDRCRNVCEKYC